MTPADRPDRADRQEPASGGAILGLDNIRLDLPIAGVGSRVLAAALDSVVVVLLVAVWGLVCALALPAALGAWRWAAFVGGFFLLDWGYFAASEIATRGRTLGKRAVGLRVVSREGGTPDATSLLLRNLLREVDVLVGVFLMAFDPLARRLGDRVGGTLVLHERRERASEATLARIPPGWGPREVALVESFFARCGELEPDQARFLARRLVAWVERDAPELLAGTDPEGDPVGALEAALLHSPETPDREGRAGASRG